MFVHEHVVTGFEAESMESRGTKIDQMNVVHQTDHVLMRSSNNPGFWFNILDVTFWQIVSECILLQCNAVSLSNYIVRLVSCLQNAYVNLICDGYWAFYRQRHLPIKREIETAKYPLEAFCNLHENIAENYIF